MVVDLEKCTGCQTCTVACKVENGLGPGLVRVSVVEMEVGKYPDVKRMYIPKRCMNCADPQCLAVCPSGATEQGEDGIVTTDTEVCIGCRYCMMACPYDARTYRGIEESYFSTPSKWEEKRYKEHPVGVVDKCDFCCDRVRQGVKDDQNPGEDPDATPFCVISCIAKSLVFGNLDEPDSEVKRLIKERKGYPLLKEMDTDPSVFYLPRRY
jgi:phenylacetyl-CoA:acceptor oxidoreductase subunit 1